MPNTSVSILGLGKLGSAIADRIRVSGYPITVWNRTPEKADPHVRDGATAAGTVAEAVRASAVTVVVLLDHASVHEQLDPVAAELRGRTVINLTTTSPNQSRASAQWAGEHGIAYLDGAVMAIPSMIGSPGARLLYSGHEGAFADARPLLETLGTAEFLGQDAGLASLKDMALLSAMDLMFRGFVQAAAMLRTVGVPAGATADEVQAWLSAMLPELSGLAKIIDGGSYDTGDQDVDFARAASASMITASREQGIRADFLESGQKLLDEQAAIGNGSRDWVQIIESLVIR